MNAAGDEDMIKATQDGAVELYHNAIKTFETMSHGAYLYGPEGGTCNLYMYADEGDDNQDKWRLRNESGSYYIQNYNDGAWESSISCQASNQVRLFYDNSEKLNTSSGGIAVTGKIYMNNGNVEFGTAGTGIDFSATGGPTNGSDSSELFDDYEEGTFTASLGRVTGSPIVSYDAQDGYYTKIGRLVTFFMEIRVNAWNNNGASGTPCLKGLPFTSAARTGGRGSWDAVHLNTYNTGMETTDGRIDIGTIEGGGTRIELYVKINESSYNSQPEPDSNDQWKVGGFYYV